jgi:hypothetical protein
MKDVFESMLKHPIASVIVLSTIGSTLSALVHGRTAPVISIEISKKSKTES